MLKSFDDRLVAKPASTMAFLTPARLERQYRGLQWNGGLRDKSYRYTPLSANGRCDSFSQNCWRRASSSVRRDGAVTADHKLGRVNRVSFNEASNPERAGATREAIVERRSEVAPAMLPAGTCLSPILEPSGSRAPASRVRKVLCSPLRRSSVPRRWTSVASAPNWEELPSGNVPKSRAFRLLPNKVIKRQVSGPCRAKLNGCNGARSCRHQVWCERSFSGGQRASTDCTSRSSETKRYVGSEVPCFAIRLQTRSNHRPRSITRLLKVSAAPMPARIESRNAATSVVAR